MKVAAIPRDEIHTEIIPRMILDLELNAEFVNEIEKDQINKILSKNFCVLVVKPIVNCTTLFATLNFEVLNRISFREKLYLSFRCQN